MEVERVEAPEVWHRFLRYLRAHQPRRCPCRRLKMTR